ncbi:hypothetical protein [Arthrobacter ramosus]|uniref:Uncharacterized protein n=1 Tax=Arthrobacter ramosus TaxID=1672 RepID=A0ABV5XVY3_ARTRM|nr:hypothetical protein [Arthrobacter ramosus]
MPHVLPRQHLLANDTNATSVLFAVYTSTATTAGHAQPHAAVIAALTGALAERHITIKNGLPVGYDTVSSYDDDPTLDCALPLPMIDSSEINAELVYRGSAIAPTAPNHTASVNKRHNDL